MIITIRNLTTDIIVAQASSSPSKFNVNRRTKHHGNGSTEKSSFPTEITLHTSVDVVMELPKGFQHELNLQHIPDTVQDLSSSTMTETQGLLGRNKWHIHPEGFKVRFSMMLGASWQSLSTPEDCPWRLFSRRISRRRHKLLILSRRNLGSFLSEMPDRLPLSSLALPGTHDTMAFHGWPISQCQSPASPLSTQLLGGIRVLDIRLAVIPPPTPILKPDIKYELIAYHGLWPQKTPFTIILKDIHAFLNSPIGMKETIVMSIKQEDFVVTPARIFSKLVRETIVHGAGGWGDSESTGHGVNKGMWFLENRIPRLGEVRGKVVMLSRFGGDGHGWEGGLEGLGIHPTTWPDSEKKGFQWELKGTLVRTHDWYGIPSFLSIPEKVKLGTENLIPPPDLKKPLLPITYFSAASFPLAFPPTVAKGFGWPKWGLGVEGVNSKLGAWLLDQLGGDAGAAYPKATNKDILLEKRPQGEQQAEPRIRGWTFLDYYSEPEGGDLVPLLIECNFRGRKEGEEGW